MRLELLKTGMQPSYRFLMGFGPFDDGEPAAVVNLDQVLHQRGDSFVAFHGDIAHPLHPHTDGDAGQCRPRGEELVQVDCCEKGGQRGSYDDQSVDILLAGDMVGKV
ncbi:hypothetical protein DSECCO2_612240 [anaerobic digester metagenome]